VCATSHIRFYLRTQFVRSNEAASAAVSNAWSSLTSALGANRGFKPVRQGVGPEMNSRQDFSQPFVVGQGQEATQEMGAMKSGAAASL
jgi:hypothetical protein